MTTWERIWGERGFVTVRREYTGCVYVWVSGWVGESVCVSACTGTRSGAPYLEQQDDDGEQMRQVAEEPEDVHVCWGVGSERETETMTMTDDGDVSSGATQPTKPHRPLGTPSRHTLTATFTAMTRGHVTLWLYLFDFFVRLSFDFNFI